MLDKVTPELKLPRQLINQLLHIAQTASAGNRWGIIGAQDHIPVHCYPFEKLDAARIAAARCKLESRSETIFAWFLIDSDGITTPAVSDLQAGGISAPLLFGVSLGTKGVLQLRGWRIEGQQLAELDVRISET
jgi:[CysO sulfur-carrier protein]-S-L-cysteine hydrolase